MSFARSNRRWSAGCQRQANGPRRPLAPSPGMGRRGSQRAVSLGDFRRSRPSATLCTPRRAMARYGAWMQARGFVKRSQAMRRSERLRRSLEPRGGPSVQMDSSFGGTVRRGHDTRAGRKRRCPPCGLWVRASQWLSERMIRLSCGMEMSGCLQEPDWEEPLMIGFRFMVRAVTICLSQASLASGSGTDSPGRLRLFRVFFSRPEVISAEFGPAANNSGSST